MALARVKIASSMHGRDAAGKGVLLARVVAAEDGDACPVGRKGPTTRRHARKPGGGHSPPLETAQASASGRHTTVA